MAHGLQKIKVLHVPGADLDHVHILEKRQLAQVHQLRDNGQARLLPGHLQILQARGAQALEGVGGGAGLEGTAPQHGGAAGLDGLGDGDDLLFGFHGAGTGHDGQVAAADLGVPHGDDRVLRMELAIGIFVGFLHPLDILHDVQSGDQVDVQLGGVAHQAQNGVGLADAGVDDDALVLEPGDQAFQLVAVRVVFENDNHDEFLLLKIPKHAKNPWPVRPRVSLDCQFFTKPLSHVPAFSQTEISLTVKIGKAKVAVFGVSRTDHHMRVPFGSLGY